MEPMCASAAIIRVSLWPGSIRGLAGRHFTSSSYLQPQLPDWAPYRGTLGRSSGTHSTPCAKNGAKSVWPSAAGTFDSSISRLPPTHSYTIIRGGCDAPQQAGHTEDQGESQ